MCNVYPEAIRNIKDFFIQDNPPGIEARPIRY